jgi:hypothetical protein
MSKAAILEEAKSETVRALRMLHASTDVPIDAVTLLAEAQLKLIEILRQTP